MKTTDLQCSKHQCCRDILIQDIDALKAQLSELKGEIPDRVQASDNTLLGAIEHWQNEAAKFKAERDQLAASVERLREHIVAYQDTGFPELLDTAMSETPSEALAEIKAQAVEEAVKLYRCKTIDGDVCYPEGLLDHAQSIRQAQEGE